MKLFGYTNRKRVHFITKDNIKAFGLNMIYDIITKSLEQMIGAVVIEDYNDYDMENEDLERLLDWAKKQKKMSHDK